MEDDVIALLAQGKFKIFEKYLTGTKKTHKKTSTQEATWGTAPTKGELDADQTL